ncbi:MAG TPA: NAD(P)H-dependent oxidoreductase, partial [Polyangiaceae bacterium]|nr:NAD(P)H-dependent oxidoreductase [Polyangiaceae bacterium]
MSSNLPILLVSGSPSAISRSASLLERLTRQLRAEGREVQLVYPSDFPASQLIEGNIDHPALAGYRQAVQAAGVVVFGTPVY